MSYRNTIFGNCYDHDACDECEKCRPCEKERPCREYKRDECCEPCCDECHEKCHDDCREKYRDDCRERCYEKRPPCPRPCKPCKPCCPCKKCSCKPHLPCGCDEICIFEYDEFRELIGECDRPKSVAANIILPGNLGYMAWDFDPLHATTVITPSAGVLHFARVAIHCKTRIRALRLAVFAPGSGLIQGQCFAGIYDRHGKLLASTCDISGGFSCAGLNTLQLERELCLEPGDYWIALLLNGETLPQLWCAENNLAMLPLGSCEVSAFFSIAGSFCRLPECVQLSEAIPATAPFWAALV